MIKILNYRNNCELNYSLVIIFGQVKPKISKENLGELRNRHLNCIYRDENQKCPITSNGRFKFILFLKPGPNIIVFKFSNYVTKLNLIYKKLPIQRHIKLYYIVCSSNKDELKSRKLFDEGRFQSNKNDSNTIENAKKRIGLSFLMIQTFLSSILPNKWTFDLDLDDENYPIVEVFQTNFSIHEFEKMNEETIWRNIAVELLQVNNSNPNLKYFAFLSFSRYNYDKKINENPNQIKYNELIKMTKCFIALGGGSLACMSTCSLFCWPEKLNEIESKFNDTTAIDCEFEFNDCGNNPCTRGGVYSNSFGTILHELCHIFDLGHETYGIMNRQFELIKYYFLNISNEVKIRWFNRSSFIILSNHKFLNKNLKYSREDCSSIDVICLESNDSKINQLKINKENFTFDLVNSKLISVNGIILIEYRDTKNSHILDYKEFSLTKKILNLSTNVYFKRYKYKRDTLIIVLDSMGNLLKFV